MLPFNCVKNLCKIFAGFGWLFVVLAGLGVFLLVVGGFGWLCILQLSGGRGGGSLELYFLLVLHLVFDLKS